MNSNLESITFNWKSLGARLASLSNIEQAEFFKGFADEMNNSLTSYQRGMQIAYITGGCDHKDAPFTKEQKEVYAALGWEED